ncbi:MAG: orotidine-5'-phosphate decarboxylase [Planctomycetota bacterium]|jgi:orotidine-5'-phosphate decarboxylase
MNDPRVIVALDFAAQAKALEFVATVSPELCKLKVGKELFTSAGPALVEKLVAQGFDVFLDLKFHDIPNTVQKAVTAAAKLGVWMVNVHAMGGEAMMSAAMEGADMVARRPFVIAVTVLTSMSESQLKAIGIPLAIPELVDQLAKQAKGCGLDGVVCSAREVVSLRQSIGSSPLLVTPGIRPTWASSDDQHRIVTPEQAIADGASYLVIGRPITQHAEPLVALAMIRDAIAN